MSAKHQIKICLACGPGGHLTEMLKLDIVYRNYDHYFVTHKRTDSEGVSKKERAYFIRAPYRRPHNVIINFLQSLRIFLKEKPDLVLATGAGIVLSTCLIAKLFNKPVIHVECSAQVYKPSLLGIIISPITDLTVVQWKPLLEQYKKARYGRLIFDLTNREINLYEEEELIFVTVGTTPEDFSRLLRKVDELAEHEIPERVVMQTGYTKYKPKHCEYFQFLEIDEYKKVVRRSKMVITHGGVGSISNSLNLGKRTIVVPRLSKFGEHANNHQLQIAKELESEGLVSVVYDIKDLGTILDKNRDSHSSIQQVCQTGIPKAVDIVKEHINNITLVHKAGKK